MNAALLEKICQGLKGSTKDIKWENDLCYLVGGKMYCVLTLKGDPCISFKTTPEEFGELIEREGIIPAPYSARHYWVLVENIHSLRTNEWKYYIQKSYELIFGKLSRKVRESL